MFNNLFNKNSESYLRRQVSKKFSKSSKEYQIKNLDIDKQFNKISEEDYDYAVLKINYHPDSLDYKLFKLDLDKKYNKIDEYTYEKTKLDLTSNKETNEYFNDLLGLFVERIDEFVQLGAKRIIRLENRVIPFEKRQLFPFADNGV